MTIGKHEAVLKLHDVQMIEEVGQVCFVQDHTPPGSHPDTLWLASDLWDDLGNAEKITITVVPGDTLTEVEDGASILETPAEGP